MSDAGPFSLDGAYPASGVLYEQPGALVSGDPSITLAGTVDGPTVGDANELDLGDGPLSIEVWFKRGTLGTNQALFSKGAGAPLIQFATNNRISLFKSGTAGSLARTPAVTDTTNWHYLVMTKEAADIHFYLDGADVTTFDKNETLINNAQGLRLGWASATTRFVGGLDDFSITAAVLSPLQVLTRYQIAIGTYVEQVPGFDSRMYPWGEPELERVLRDEEDDEEALIAALASLDP